MAYLHNIPGIPEDVLKTLYNWETADEQQLSKAKQYFFGRSDILFDLKFYGDVVDGSAYIACTVFDKAGDKGNLDILGEMYINHGGYKSGWHFTTTQEIHEHNWL